MNFNEFQKKLVQVIRYSGFKELAIVVDGQYCMHLSKLVYVKASESDSGAMLKFYTKTVDSLVGVSGVNEIPEFAHNLFGQCLTGSIGDVIAPGQPDVEFAQISVCSEMKLLIIESHLYAAIRASLESDASVSGVMFGSEPITGQDLKALQEAFIRQAFTNYGKLIYGGQSNRFLSRANKLDKFFAIQRAFIPVYIDYKKIYNPFRNNKIVEKTKLFKTIMNDKMATRKRSTDTLDVYFLTHKEICEIMGMSHFMRFTPLFFYRIFTGLLFPNYDEFPNKLDKVMVRPEGLQTMYLKKTIMSLQEAAKIGINSEAVLDNPESSDDARKEASERINELTMYQELNSLYAECAANHNQLVNIGSGVLDSREDTSVARLYGYVSEAKVLFD